MKELIITSGILLFMVTVMAVQTELHQVMHEAQELKFAADEACATAGLCLDAESYGDGVLRFDRGKAEKEARAITALNLPGKAVEMRFTFREDTKPSVRILLTCGRLSAASEYEYVGS